MASEARYPALVHLALHEIVTLHPIFVSGAICKMHEVGFAEFVLFKLPEIFQVRTLMKTDRPIVVLSHDRIL